jgi:hypothetical protein
MRAVARDSFFQTLRGSTGTPNSSQQTPEGRMESIIPLTVEITISPRSWTPAMTGAISGSGSSCKNNPSQGPQGLKGGVFVCQALRWNFPPTFGRHGRKGLVVHKKNCVRTCPERLVPVVSNQTIVYATRVPRLRKGGSRWTYTTLSGGCTSRWPLPISSKQVQSTDYGVSLPGEALFYSKQFLFRGKYRQYCVYPQSRIRPTKCQKYDLPLISTI